MRQEPVDQGDLGTSIVEQQDPADESALALLDHPHRTASLLGIECITAYFPTLGGAPCRYV